VRDNSAHDRQVQIDAVRTLAELAADIEELVASRAEHEVIMSRTRAVVGTRQLQPIGAVGARCPFDPAEHDVLAGSPGDGEPVEVIRPGYRWNAHDQSVVLSKAFVSTAEED
jgi:hypothetical protein